MVIKETDKKIYLRNLLIIMGSVHPDSNEIKLDKKELKYMTESLFLEFERGIPMNSTENVDLAMDFMGYKNKNSVYNLRSRIKGKGWISEGRNGYEYPSVLKKSQFNMNYQLEDGYRGQNKREGG